MSEYRWIMARIVGVGECVFETAEPLKAGALISARRLTLVQTGRDGGGGITRNVAKIPSYGLGLLSDPFALNVANIVWCCEAPKGLAAGCSEAWTDIVVPPPGTLNRLDGGKKR